MFMASVYAGVGPQEYTLIKMKALELRGKLSELEKLAPGAAVYFMAATLRPETMYGQTNCWVLPEGDYGAFQAPDNAVYIMCDARLICLISLCGLVHVH
jgi:leucyl-tRNA synthetase